MVGRKNVFFWFWKWTFVPGGCPCKHRRDMQMEDVVHMEMRTGMSKQLDPKLPTAKTTCRPIALPNSRNNDFLDANYLALKSRVTLFSPLFSPQCFYDPETHPWHQYWPHIHQLIYYLIGLLWSHKCSALQCALWLLFVSDESSMNILECHLSSLLLWYSLWLINIYIKPSSHLQIFSLLRNYYWLGYFY